ncbi:protein S100-P-like isoform X2 [Bufo gargarizans]|uniref:protein S100-P-like isoform X2 n=1 Tax=Bufo gargarizans TaxID=30331 RepID=UPI001CF0F1F5|nr:protein S100-P-like isoform X2 [Bufo gargarizans]
MNNLITAIYLMINVFGQYACTEGNKDTLSKGELKTMIEKELPGLIKLPGEAEKLKSHPNMSKLITAIYLIINVFDKYASTEGKKDTLSKGDLKTMMEKELPGLMRNAKGKDEWGQLLKDLDKNGDSEVDFQEFIILVAAITCLEHERFQHMSKK